MDKTNSTTILYLLPLISTLLLTSCANTAMEKEGLIFERKGVSTLLIPAQMRDVYFNDPNSRERHCRAPGPDVSIESSSGISLSLPTPSIPGGSDKLGEDNNQSALSLGGRNPDVLIARELMYRACEVSSNLNANQKTTLLIYERFLQALEKISTTQTASGTASLVDAGTNSIIKDSSENNSSEDDSSKDDN